MTRRRSILVALVPVILAVTAFAALAHAAPIAQTTTPMPACQVGVTSAVDPDQLRLGDTVKVTLNVTHTCPVVIPPTDLVFLVDVSNSMTKGEAPRVDDPCGPDPNVDPLPIPTKPDPLQTPPTPGGEPTEPEPGNEATPCPTRRANLPVDPTGNAPSPIVRPTGNAGNDATPTKVNPFQTPPTPVPGGDPTKAPTSGTVPGGTPTSNVDPRPIPGAPREERGTEDLIREVQQLLRQLLKEQVILDAAAQNRLRIGLVAFESRPHTISWPTNNLARINSGLSRLANLPHGTTNAGLGYYRAHQALTRGGATNIDANRIVIVFSDGKFDQRSIRSIRQRVDTTYAAVAMGKAPDLKKLGDVVSDRKNLVTQRDYPQLAAFVTGILTRSRALTMKSIVVQDELAGNMSYRPGSSSPPTVTQTGQLLEWRFEPATSPVTVTFDVEPLEPGRWPLSVRADMIWTDGESRTGTVPFAPLEVLVIGPTPTNTPETPVPTVPTSTPVPTDTPTPTEVPPTATATLPPKPVDIYFPFAVKRWPPEVKPPECIPQEQTVDVALVIDTSDSMTELTSTGRTKLEAAIEAGLLLADQLKLDGRGDQVTVIGFNSQATVAVALTSDRNAVRSALQRLPSIQARGTKINLALVTALVQLTGPAHIARNNSAVVLLTDGKHEGTTDEVRTAAASVKASGIFVYAVGIGDVDVALLQEVASSPVHYFYSPDAEGLRDIYRRIADVIPCP